MIVTEMYNGQGLGNQLWCYVVTRVIALDHNYKFGIMHPERIKSISFMDLDFGEIVTGGSSQEGGPPCKLPDKISSYYKEEKILHPVTGEDISTFDKYLTEVPDNTKIDGNMQDEKYIAHRKTEIRNWLKVKNDYDCFDYSDNNTCVINFRGGEYRFVNNVFLRKKYWEDAVANMLHINKNFKFVVITDDVKTAKTFFPDFEVFHFNIGKDFSIVKNAKYLILSNSSFGWFPAWLNVDLKYCIAPKYWWAHNNSDGYWACGYNITNGWYYQDKDGKLFSYSDCAKEFNKYVKRSKIYSQLVTIDKNFLVVSNYNNDINWVAKRTNNYLIYDRSDNGQVLPYTIDKNKVVKTSNVGYNIFDYLTYIVTNYNSLPETIILAKGNVFPRHVQESFFDKVSNNDCFTSIENVANNKTKWPISFLSSDGGFNEINNSWYMNHYKSKYFNTYTEFVNFLFTDAINSRYLRFAPGANYIVKKGNILKYPIVFYKKLLALISYTKLPAEAHLIERSLYTIWNCNFTININNLMQGDIKIMKKISYRQNIKSRVFSLFPNSLKKKILYIYSKLNQLPLNIKTPEEERKVFDLLKSDFKVVFDVGARNEISFYEMKKDAEFHLFEPNIEFSKQIKKEIKKYPNSKIHLNEYGLSDIESDNCVYYEKSQSFIINPTFSDGDVDTGIRFSLKKLDAYIVENNINCVDYLKIDAEGMDYRILLGGINAIKSNKIRYIQFEYWDGVTKFVKLLRNYNLYLMMEPVLLNAIKSDIFPRMNRLEKKIDFDRLIVPLDLTLINLIDKKIIPTGNGGNILAVNKKNKKFKLYDN